MKYFCAIILLFVLSITKSQNIETIAFSKQLIKRDGYVLVYWDIAFYYGIQKKMTTEYAFFCDSIPSDIFSKDYLTFFKNHKPDILLASNYAGAWDSIEELQVLYNKDNFDSVFIQNTIWNGCDAISKILFDTNQIAKNIIDSDKRKIVALKVNMYLYESKKKMGFSLRDYYHNTDYSFNPDFYMRKFIYFNLPQLDLLKLIFVVEFEN
ncbi:MAG: hypothetical protein WCP69_02770 [Bacteroidota bacterium]